MKNTLIIRERLKEKDFELPYNLIARRNIEFSASDYCAEEDVVIKITSMNGSFRLTPKQQEIFGNFLLKKDRRK